MIKLIFLGMSVQNSALYSYTLSGATLLLIILNPILTPLADTSGRRKLFMKIFCYIGALSCMYLAFFTKTTITSGIVAFGFSIVGWGGSIVFYNSFLPQIATEDRFDGISAKGFSLGFVGSVILLVINLLMIQKPEIFGFTLEDSKTGLTARISFLTVGIWWIAFAQIPFYYLPKDNPKKLTNGWFRRGFLELKKINKRNFYQTIVKKIHYCFFLLRYGRNDCYVCSYHFCPKRIKNT